MRAGLAVLIAAVAVLAAGVAYASIPDGAGVIHACLGHKGALRIVDTDAGDRCTKRETALAWSQVGPKGDPGDRGDKGDPGPQGPIGPAADFGTGAGLEKLTFSSPPPIGDQTLLQIGLGHRLPQACSAGAVPQKSGGGAGWVCGDATAGSSLAVLRSQERDLGIDNVSGGVPLATTLEPGSWAISVAGEIENRDNDDVGSCNLTVGGTPVAFRSWTVIEDGGLIGGETVTLLAAVTLTSPADVHVECDSLADGTEARGFSLLAIRVGSLG